MRDMETIIRHKGVRSADRASLETMLRRLRGGDPLSYQERVNLWAYLNRYQGYVQR